LNEILQDTRFWLTSLGAVVVGLIRYLWKKQEKRLEALESEMVRRSELEQLREDMREEHQENSSRLDRIETGVTSTHKRLDDLYRDLIRAQSDR
jgi:TolA-binding protein